MKAKHLLFGMSFALVAGMAAGLDAGSAIAADNDSRTFDLATQDHNLLVVVDNSGSMTDELPKIKSAVKAELGKLQGGDRAGLVHFNGCGAETVHYDVPLASGSADQVANVIGGLQGEGMTDLVAAFSRVQQIMQEQHTCLKLVLFTDYQDTCTQQDPLDIVNSMKQYCMQINVVTFATGGTLAYFNRLAEATGGRVFIAKTAAQKKEALKQIVNTSSNHAHATFETGASSSQSSSSTSTVKSPAHVETKQPAHAEAGAGSGN